MISRPSRTERGFTALEITVVVAIAGIVMAFAAPRITSAMRQHRLNIATRQVVDTLKRAKMQAMSENRTASVAVDLDNNQIGTVVFNDDGTVNRVDYIPLAEGISFQRPPDILGDPDGNVTDGVVSFGEQGGLVRQDFTSRGFPNVAFGANISLYVGNGEDYRAIVMSSVGGVSLFRAEGGAWVDTRERYSSRDYRTQDH
ncbi:MAG TPA: type II secretion system protein [Blastocatellia bacterium]|nr:type II secretion system protein [Blastocatellia bacterium]